MAEEIAVGKTKDFDMTFEQRERYLRETEKEEMRKSKLKSLHTADLHSRTLTGLMF